MSFNKLELFILKEITNIKFSIAAFANHATTQPLSMNAQTGLSVFLIRESVLL